MGGVRGGVNDAVADTGAMDQLTSLQDHTHLAAISIIFPTPAKWSGLALAP